MSLPMIDRTGQRFGHWTVIEYRGRSTWLVRCDCGKERVTSLTNMVFGKSRSCGCGVLRGLSNCRVKRPEFIDREFSGQVVRQRSSDGYFDATAMCKIGGKLIGHWNSLQSTHDYLQHLSTVIGIPITELVVVNQGGDHNSQGTWIHPRAAMRLAQWISPEFAILVDGWVLDLVEGKVDTFGPRQTQSVHAIPEPAKALSMFDRLPTLADAEKELAVREREVKALRQIVTGLKKAQRLLAFN